MKTQTAVLTASLLMALTFAPLRAQDQSQDASQSASQDQTQATPDQQDQVLQQRLQTLKDRLNLTPAQVEQVRPVLRQELVEIRAVRDKYQGDQSTLSRIHMARQLKKVQENGDAKLKKVLTKAQMDELQKVHEETKEQIREKAGQQK